MADLMTDEEAVAAYEAGRMDEVWGTPIPADEWVGPGLVDETEDGRGDDDDRE